MNIKKILVTGGAGYVGSILVPKLLRDGHEVTVIDALYYDDVRQFFSYFVNPSFNFVRGDVRDRELMTKLVKDKEYIIHLAAIVGFPACRRNPKAAVSINYESTKLLCDITSENQKILFPSTGSVYGKVDGICTEESVTNPLTIYGKTKLDAEKCVLATGRGTAYRFATAFGLSPRLRLDLMVNDFVYQALTVKNLIVYEKDFRRTFVHVSDIVRSFEFAIEHFDEMCDNVYNLGSESMNYTKEEIAKKIQTKVDYYLHFAEFGTDPDQRDYAVSYEKIRKLGFDVTVTMDAGLDELITGLQNFSIPNPYSNANLDLK